jgi:hypothetical protein
VAEVVREHFFVRIIRAIDCFEFGFGGHERMILTSK